MAKKGTPILDGAFEVLHVKPGVIGYGRSYVDLTKITVAQAEDLVSKGFPYLKKVEKKTTKAEKPDDK